MNKMSAREESENYRKEDGGDVRYGFLHIGFSVFIASIQWR